MVLYKRKQVTYVKPPPAPYDLSAEVFVIPHTKEWFYDYEAYLARMDYYRTRKFVCEITGNSCLTFFEAQDSESKEIKDVERNFPEALREHILRFLQFNRITRLDQLVDKVYLIFKNEYFPGETIFIKGSLHTGAEEDHGSTVNEDGTITSVKQKGVIREKVQYSNPADGLTTKYLVARLSDGQQAIVTKDKISRDRNHFTKWLIKTFIKLTMSRSHKVGAPWVVKDKYAKKYRIPQIYPEDLEHFKFSTPSGEILYDEPNGGSLSAPKAEALFLEKRAALQKKKAAASKGLKKGSLLRNMTPEEHSHPKTPPVGAQRSDPRSRFPQHHLPDQLQRELLQQQESGNGNQSISSLAAAIPPSKKHIVSDLELAFDLQNRKPIPEKLRLPQNAQIWNKKLVEELTIDTNKDDDLDIEIVEDGSKEEEQARKEQIALFKKQQIARISRPVVTAILEALETWVFLNIYHSVLKIDTFTFDDFIYAMGWNHTQYTDIGRCDMLDEIWCGVLGACVSSLPNEKSKNRDIPGLLITLPPKESFINPPIKTTPKTETKEEEEEEEARGSDSEQEHKALKIEEDESANESGSEIEGSKKKKVSKKDKIEENGEDADIEVIEDEELESEDDSDEEEVSKFHNAYQVINHRGTLWHERLRKRNFKDGNWQTIMLGILSLVEHVPAYSDTIEQAYRILAPLEAATTPASVLTEFYKNMDIDLRLKVLNIIAGLLVNGTRVRTYIDESLDNSTTLRRNRLDNLRDYKISLDTAQKAHNAIFEILLAEDKEKENLEKKSKKSNGLENDDAKSARRKTKLDLLAPEKTEEEESLAAKNSTFKEAWEERQEALIKLKEYKNSKREIELKLREIDCQRVRLLGKDRLYNRYWWFENNGLPNLHVTATDEDNEDEEGDKTKAEENADDVDDDDDDEVLEETYLMGRLWIQGPTNEDLRVHFKTNALETEKFHDASYEIERSLGEVEEEETEPEMVDFGDGKPPLKKINYGHLPKAFTQTSETFYSLQFSSDRVVRLEDSKIVPRTTLLDDLGGIPFSVYATDFSTMERKILEEAPAPLLSGCDWRYYDNVSQIEQLIEWLNPWGLRESLLRKELVGVKDAITFSIEARRKALWMDGIPDSEKDLQDLIQQIAEKISALGADEIAAISEEESDEDPVSRKRSFRKKKNFPRKKARTMSPSEVLESGNADELQALLEKLQKELALKKEDREHSRVLEWVNSCALEEFDKSLYDGGDRPKPAKRGRKPATKSE